MASLPVDFRFYRIVKFFLKKFYSTKRFAVKFQGESLGVFFTYPVDVITDFDPYVSLLTNKSATVNLKKIKAKPRQKSSQHEFPI